MNMTIIPSNYGAIVFDFLIDAATIFSVAFIAGFVGLILRRIWEKKHEAKFQAVKKQARMEAMAWLNAGDESEQEIRVLLQLPKSQRIEIFEGLARMLKGQFSSRLTSLAEHLEIHKFLAKRLRSWNVEQRIAAARILSLIQDDKALDLLANSMNTKNKTLAAVCAEGIVEQASNEQAIGIAQSLLEKNIHPFGIGKRTFKIICRNHTASVLDFTHQNSEGPKIKDLLSFLVEEIGAQVVPLLRRHPGLNDPVFGRILHAVLSEKRDRAFKKLTEELANSHQIDCPPILNDTDFQAKFPNASDETIQDRLQTKESVSPAEVNDRAQSQNNDSAKEAQLLVEDCSTITENPLEGGHR